MTGIRSSGFDSANLYKFKVKNGLFPIEKLYSWFETVLDQQNQTNRASPLWAAISQSWQAPPPCMGGLPEVPRV
jgi:hypothetical protein